MVKILKNSGYDYANQYNDFWSRSDRMGTESYLDRNDLVESIIQSVGYGKILDLGCGEGRLVRALVEKGVDAYGLDISKVAVERANSYMPERFFYGSAINLPFDDKAFDTIVSTDCLEHIHPVDIKLALQEMRRVCKKNVYLQIATTQDRDDHWHLTVENRDWWESVFFDNGFIRAPHYYKINNLNDISSRNWQITILLEVDPSWTSESYKSGPLRSISAESHAYLAAYKEMAEFIRPGDIVINWAEESSDGAYILRNLSNAQHVHTFLDKNYIDDISDSLIDGSKNPYIHKQSDLTEFCQINSAKIGTAIIEGNYPSLTNNTNLHDALSPGARLIILEKSITNGELEGSVPPSTIFTLETVVAVSFLKVDFKLSIYIKKFSKSNNEFIPSVHGYSTPPSNLINFERDYDNPWLPFSLVINGIRTKNNQILINACNEILEKSTDFNTPDYAAALCVAGYRLLEKEQFSVEEIEAYIKTINNYLSLLKEHINPHVFRWKVSLTHLNSKLLLKIGRIDLSLIELYRVASFDIVKFSPTLGTKVVSAYIDIGNIRCAKHQYVLAKEAWTKGMQKGIKFLQVDEAEWIGDPELPIKGALHEATQIADLVNICALSLRALNLHLSGNLSFNKIWSEASDSVFLINKKRFRLLEKQEVHIFDLNEASKAQAKMLEERWTVMQSMELMIHQRDMAISSQANTLEDRWAALQSMEEMIHQRDITIISQAKYLDDRWNLMQSMEEMIRQRDNDLALNIENTKTSINNFKEKIRERDALLFMHKKINDYNQRAIETITNEMHEQDILAILSKKLNGSTPFQDLSLSNYIFINNLYDLSIKLGIRDLFFFSREGKPLKEMFDLFKSYKEDGHQINTHYLKVSRRSTFLLSLSKLKNENFEVLFRQYRRISVLDFLKSLALEEHASLFALDIGVQLNDLDVPSEDLPNDPLFQSLLTLGSFMRIYEDERTSRSKAFESYLSGLVKSDVPETLHVVDVGWKGSIQDNLFNWLKGVHGENAKISGYYLGLISTGILSEKNSKSGLLFSNINYKTPGFYIFNENRSLYEVTLHADHGSAQRYVTRDIGTVVVEDDFQEKEMIEKLVSPVSIGIMNSFCEITAFLANIKLSNNSLLKLALKRHARMVFSPSQKEIDWILSISHIENFGVFEKSQFLVRQNPDSLIEKLKFTFRLVKNSKSLDFGFWPWLTLEKRAVIGVSYLYKLYRLRQIN